MSITKTLGGDRVGSGQKMTVQLENFGRASFNTGLWFNTPREAFASLIDKVSGRGTWASNPWVVAYEFELVK